MNQYIEDDRTYFYAEVNKKMVELHVDDFYNYDIKDKDVLSVIWRYGCTISIRLPSVAKPKLCFSQDDTIFRSSQLNDSCLTVDGEVTLWTKGLGTGVMVCSMVSCAFGFGLDITYEQMLDINKKREGKSYIDSDAATHLFGQPTKPSLSESPFDQ